MRPQYTRLLLVWGIWGPIVGALLIWFLTIGAYVYVAFLIVISGFVIVLPLIWDWIIFQINRTKPGQAVLARIHPRGKAAAEVATYLSRGIQTNKGSFLGFGLRRVEIVWTKKPEMLGEKSTEDAIIYLEPNLNNEEGLLMALEEYVEKVFMNAVRITCGREVASAIKIALMESLGKEFLTRTTKMKSLYAEFIRTLAPADSEKREKFDSFLQTLRNSATGGMFESIFMYLLKFIADKLTIKEITGLDLAEKTLIEFATFLETISLKERGEDVPLTFETDLVKAPVILITRPERSSLKPHLDRLIRYAGQAYNPVFVSGMGKNTQLVGQFIKKARELQVKHELVPFSAFESTGRVIKEGVSYEVRTYALEFHWEQAR